MRQITVDVPHDVPDQKVRYLINRLFSPDWMAIYWHISDIQDAAGDLPMSAEDAREILEELDEDHNANVGINWDVINVCVDAWRKEQEEI